MRAALLICAALCAGCSAKYPEGVLACSKQSECPSGWVCRVDRYCYSTPAKAAATAGATGGASGIGGIIKRL